jgi:predicted nuclease with TOPRIM domain
MKIGPNTTLELRLMDYSIILGAVITAVGVYYALKNDIERAMVLPEAEVTREYLESRNAILEAGINKTQEDICDVKESVSDMREMIERLDGRIYEIHRNTSVDYAYENY